MAGNCCESNCSASPDTSPRYRRILWIALWTNAAMFGVELLGGFQADSVSLLADAIDFAGDAMNYGLALAVLSMGLLWRSRTAWVKGLTMALYGGFVLAKAGWSAWSGASPEPFLMGGIAILALFVNASVAVMLYAYRQGDANQRSVWLCSRNDAIVNVAIILAAAGVFGTGTRWPDLAVALMIAGLALSAGITVMSRARAEMLRDSSRSPVQFEPAG